MTILTHLAMDQVAAEANDSGNKTPSPDDRCANCGAKLNGAFCHDCGQSSRSMIKFFGVVVKELLDDFIGYDSRLKHSIFPLLFKPGEITRDYVKGRRFHYVLPFRLYLITSVLLILSIKLVADIDQFNMDQVVSEFDQKELSQEDAKALKEDLQDAKSQLTKLKESGQLTDIPNIDAIIDNATEASEATASNSRVSDEPAEENSPVIEEPSKAKVQPNELKNEQINDTEEENKTDDFKLTIGTSSEDTVNLGWDKENRQLTNIDSMKDGMVKTFFLAINPKIKFWYENPRPLIISIIEAFPYMMFLFLPIFAVILKIFYAFSKRYYVEHLIFLLHNHSFIYISILLMIGLDISQDAMIGSESGFVQAIGTAFGWLHSLLSLWMLVYVFIAMKRFYQQGWGLTITKALALGLIYNIMLVFGFVFAIAVGAYQA